MGRVILLSLNLLIFFVYLLVFVCSLLKFCFFDSRNLVYLKFNVFCLLVLLVNVSIIIYAESEDQMLDILNHVTKPTLYICIL